MYSSCLDIPSVCRVSTFGHPRVEACLRLTVAFRSLPRPSSALGARASALCSCSLDFLLILRPFLNRLLCSLLFTSYSRTKSVYLSRKIATRNWPSLPYFAFGFSLSSSLCSCQGAPSLKVMMVGRSGLEPPTSRLSGECSNQLS